jgi:hypothetical protein
MHGDALVPDVFQNAIVGCRCPADIVFRLQSIDGDDYVQSRQTCPGRTHRSEGAGNDLHMDSTSHEEGNQQLKLAVPDQRVTPDDGQVQRLQSIDNFKNAVH